MKSIYDSEGCPTTQNPKVDDDIAVEVDRHEETTGMKESVQKGKSELEVNPEIMDNYNPWMLAGRKPRRMEHDKKETKNMGNEKRNVAAPTRDQTKGGSFTILANLDEDSNVAPKKEQVEEVVVINYVEVLPRQAPLRSKGKRAPVQTNQKDNDPINQHTLRSMTTHRVEGDQDSQTKVKIASISRHAAAENEHVVIRSSDGGQAITREIVLRPTNKDAIEDARLLFPNIGSTEHH